MQPAVSAETLTRLHVRGSILWRRVFAVFLGAMWATCGVSVVTEYEGLGLAGCCMMIATMALLSLGSWHGVLAIRECYASERFLHLGPGCDAERVQWEQISRMRYRWGFPYHLVILHRSDSRERISFYTGNIGLAMLRERTGLDAEYTQQTMFLRRRIGG
jgi:hypothetical protein